MSGESKSLPLSACPGMTTKAPNTDGGVTNTFQRIGEFTNMESGNNEKRMSTEI